MRRNLSTNLQICILYEIFIIRWKVPLKDEKKTKTGRSYIGLAYVQEVLSISAEWEYC